jgi:adenine-specific DNA methylase
MTVRPLIEQWFPASAVGAESLRERGSAKAFPPINYLHTWWARRPLIASRAAVLASLLPAWPTEEEVEQDPDALRVLKSLEEEFPGGVEAYRKWFISGIGILGDPEAGRKAIATAVASGRKTKGNAYGYDRAFLISPDSRMLSVAKRLICSRSEMNEITVLDPFSGGGAIPFEAARLGFNTISNELNPVAVAILNGTVVLPSQLGPEFASVIQTWGETWAERVGMRLADYFPHVKADEQLAYIWAWTVPCPTTGRATPLIPDCALSGNGIGAAFRLYPDLETGDVRIEIVDGKAASESKAHSTYKRGTGQSIWTGETFGGEYIRDMGQAGRMGEMLLAVSVSRPGVSGRTFRAPSEEDLRAIEMAKSVVKTSMTRWEIEDLVPTEAIPEGWKTEEPRRIGVVEWRQMFSPRQLLTAAVALDELRSLIQEATGEIGEEKAKALNLYLAFAFDRAISHNSRFSTWDMTRGMVRSLFVRHDFAVKWTYAELDGASSLIPWAVNNAVVNHKKITSLLIEEATMLSPARAASARVIWGSATSLPLLAESVAAIVTDPPYYDNVMYAELSDFFFVWLKRSLRDTWPELTTQDLTDKQDEAVANPSLFRNVATVRGRKKPGEKSASDLADEHYEDLLTQSFREAHRVLSGDGVLTVMFTHKRVDAWDTLGQALLEAGFLVNSSWSVHTEDEHSSHIAKKNSASSTILLTCRKRGDSVPAYWNDIRGEISSVALDRARQFSEDGLAGIDLTISTFGPVLSVLSRNWPVYTGQLDVNGAPEVLRPEVALDLAREEVSRLKKRGLLGGRDVEFDRVTDWYLLAWSDFAAAEFPYDEGRKLSLAVHLEMDDLAKIYKIVRALSGVITMLTPAQRRTSGGFDPEAASWPTLIDSLHALMLVYEEDGLSAAEAWLVRTGKADDSQFRDLFEAALHAIPRVMDKGEFARPEAAILEGLRATIFDDIAPPVDPEVNVQPPAQLFELG